MSRNRVEDVMSYDELPGLEHLGACHVGYTYYPGCADYFAGGCWNPGDPPNVEVLTITPDDDALGGEFCPLEPLTAWLADKLAVDAAEAGAEDYYEEPDGDLRDYAYWEARVD